MSVPRILEKFIVWMVFLGLLAFCFGYLYVVAYLLRGYGASIEFWVLIIPFVLLFLAAFCLKVFRNVFRKK